MHTIKWTTIAFAVAAASSQLANASQQAQSQGFFEDSELTLNSRLLHFDRDFKRGSIDGVDQRATGLGLNLAFESGYTQGAVGFGVDAFGLQGLKLHAKTPHQDGIDMFPTKGDNGKAKSHYSQAGIAAKAQVSNSSLKIGDQFVDLPVFSTDDSRLLPQSTTGGLLTSNELEQLELHLGHFTKLSEVNHSARNSFKLDKVSLGGLNFAFNEDLSVAYYFAKTSNIWETKGDNAKKHYVNLNYTYELGEDHSINADFNAYRTIYTSNAASKQTNNARSMALTYSLGAHSLTFARQCVEGDGAYEYGYDGWGTVYLANDKQIHGFHQAGEVSNQIGYDLDMDSYGVPGLSFSAAYVRGSKIHDQVNGGNKGKNWERDFGVKYVVQQGTAKDLSLELRQASYRANAAAMNGGFASYGSKIDEVRLIVEYPLSLP